MFLFYLVTYFIVVFFNSGLVTCVRMRLAGEEPTVRDGLSFSVANVGLNAAFSLLAFLPTLAALILAGVAGAMLANSAPAAAAVLFFGTLLLCIIYWIGLAIIQSALQGIFLTACYQYAMTGEVPSVFSREHIVEAWRPKKKK